MKISSDSMALFLLASHLGLSEESETKPLSAREWYQLEPRLKHISRSADDLRGETSQQIAAILEIDTALATRIASLFDRIDQIDDELDRLDELGIWVITRFDEHYPARFAERLKTLAPLVLYGAGDPQLMSRPGLAVVGSRNIDERGYALTEVIGSKCAESRLTVFSGGARGVDKTAMGAALASNGTAVGVLADSLEKAIRAADARAAIEDGNLTLTTPYSPRSSFNVGLAMARNKLIYALADFALVIASDAEKGGTWAGAEEALKADWIPVFVVDGPETPDGNKLLLKRGGVPFPLSFKIGNDSLEEWLEQNVPHRQPLSIQGSLFG